MSTVADLPASARRLTGPSNAWQGNQDVALREETITWAVPWADSNAFYAAVVGTKTTISYGSGSNGSPQPTVTRYIPLQHPWNNRLYATKLAWKGQDGPNKPAGADYAWVIINVTFGYLGYSVGASNDQGNQAGNQNGYPPFLKISGKSTSRAITDTSRKYTYTTPGSNGKSGNPLNQNVAVLFGGITYQLTLFCIPDLAAWQAIMNPLKGTVNSQPLAIGTYTQPAGTVLLESYEFEDTVDVMGNMNWTGMVSLNCSSLPWNSVFVGGQVCALSPPAYPTADHNSLYY